MKPNKSSLFSRIGQAILGRGTASSSDIREETRLRIRIPVQIRTALGLHQHGMTVNLSTTGMFVEAASIPLVGSTITVLFAGPPGDPAPIRIQARVVWTALQGRKGMGLKIDRKDLSGGMWARYLGLMAYYVEGGIPLRLAACI